MAKDKNIFAVDFLVNYLNKHLHAIYPRIPQHIAELAKKIELDNLESTYYKDRLNSETEIGKDEGLEFQEYLKQNFENRLIETK